jgi:hypothetical protein
MWTDFDYIAEGVFTEASLLTVPSINSIASVLRLLSVDAIFLQSSSILYWEICEYPVSSIQNYFLLDLSPKQVQWIEKANSSTICRTHMTDLKLSNFRSKHYLLYQNLTKYIHFGNKSFWKSFFEFSGLLEMSRIDIGSIFWTFFYF